MPTRKTGNPLKTAALAYARRGWPIFPCKPYEKVPLGGHGVLDATTNEDNIRAWWDACPDANIGLDVGGAGMMVLDLDPGADLTALTDNAGPIPHTYLEQTTPRNGCHQFFTINDGEVVSPSASKLAPSVDVRSHNSYVLLAPSKTKDGSYEWVADSKPAHRTDDMVRAANVGRRKRSDNRDQWLVNADKPENIERAIRWLRGPAQIAVEGQGGDAKAFATAGYMCSLAISEAKALELMWEHWNPRCEPPWGPDEYDHFSQKVANAYEYNSSAPGNLTDAYHAAKLGFKEVVNLPEPAAPPGEEEEDDEFWDTAGRPPPGLYNGPDYAERPPAEWLLPNLVQKRSYSIASGRSQAGKSFSELALALAVATGREWLSFTPTTSGPVLYVAAEGQERIWLDVLAWCDENKVDPHTLRGRFWIYDRSARLNTEEGRGALQRLLGYIEGSTGALPVYVVFDTLRRNMKGSVSDEDNAADVIEMMDYLVLQGVTATLVAHMGRGHGETKGLTDWEDNADQVRHYTGTVKNRDTYVEFAKIKSAEDGWGLGVEYSQRKVYSDDEATTLVVVGGQKKEKPKPQRQNNKAPSIDPAILDILEPIVVEELKKDRLVEYSDTSLARLVAHRKDVPVGEGTLRVKYLPLLRADGERHTNDCYDPRKKRWRYQEKED